LLDSHPVLRRRPGEESLFDSIETCRRGLGQAGAVVPHDGNSFFAAAAFILQFRLPLPFGRK
jgi:hypothetical protein